MHIGYAYTACGMEIPADKIVVTEAVTCRKCIASMLEDIDTAIEKVQHRRRIFTNALLPNAESEDS